MDSNLKGSVEKMKKHVEHIPRSKRFNFTQYTDTYFYLLLLVNISSKRTSPGKTDRGVGTNSQRIKKDMQTNTNNSNLGDISKISIKQFDVSGDWDKDDDHNMMK